jgi:hypothetical protein
MGSALRGSSRTNRRGLEQFQICDVSLLVQCQPDGPRHAYQHPVLPCGFGIGDPVVSANVGAGNFYRYSGAADIGAEWRKPDRAAIAGTSRRVLDPRENAGGQAGDAYGAGNAAGRLLDICPGRPERRCAGPGAAGSA